MKHKESLIEIIEHNLNNKLMKVELDKIQPCLTDYDKEQIELHKQVIEIIKKLDI